MSRARRTSPLDSARVLPSSRVSVAGDVLEALGEQLGGAEEDGAAGRRRRRPPGGERLGRRGGRLGRVLGRRRREDGEHLVGVGRVPRLEAGVVAGADPPAADEVLARLHRRPPRSRCRELTWAQRYYGRRPPRPCSSRRAPSAPGVAGTRGQASGSGTSARSERRSVSRYPAARACAIASSQARPTCSASWASESMVSGMPRACARAQDLERRVHDAGRVGEAVACSARWRRRTPRARPAPPRSPAAPPDPAGVPTG